MSLLHRYCVSSLSSPRYLFCKRFLTTSFIFSEDYSPTNTNEPPLLEVKDLKAVVAESNQEILKGVNLVVRRSEIHAIVGEDGSGKSTLLKVLLGHPDYKVTGGSILCKGNNLLDLNPEERRSSTEGFISLPDNTFEFLSVSPAKQFIGADAVVPTASNLDDLQEPIEIRRLGGGGEEKPFKIPQYAVLGSVLGMLDEIDARLDDDGMRAVVNAMNKLLVPNYRSLMITHFMELSKFMHPNDEFIHAMEDGKMEDSTPFRKR